MFDRMRQSSAYMMARSFLPSRLSLSVCILLGVGAMLTHVSIATLKYGAVFPNFLDGHWSTAYAIAFKEPVTAFLAQTSLNNVLVIVIWGLMGLVVFSIAERAYGNLRDWRDAEHDIQLIDPQHVIQHPAERPFYLTLLWRSFVALLFVMWAIIAIILLNQLVTIDRPPFFGINATAFNWSLAIIVIEWSILLHTLVVIARLSARRSRLLGQHHLTAGRNSFFRE